MKQKFPERSIYLKWLATAIPMAGNLRGSLFGYLFFNWYQRRTIFSVYNYITHIRLIIKIARYIFYQINIIICPIFVLSIKDFN